MTNPRSADLYLAGGTDFRRLGHQLAYIISQTKINLSLNIHHLYPFRPTHNSKSLLPYREHDQSKEDPYAQHFHPPHTSHFPQRHDPDQGRRERWIITTSPTHGRQSKTSNLDTLPRPLKITSSVNSRIIWLRRCDPSRYNQGSRKSSVVDETFCQASSRRIADCYSRHRPCQCPIPWRGPVGFARSQACVETCRRSHWTSLPSTGVPIFRNGNPSRYTKLIVDWRSWPWSFLLLFSN